MAGSDNLVIVGCSRRKLRTTTPVPALDLYQGGCIPQLRRRVGPPSARWDHLAILSAKHGLVAADQPLLPYDLVLTPERAAELRPNVTRTLLERFQRCGTPSELLVVLEPLYFVPLADLLSLPDRPHIRWVPDARAWEQASSVLDEWGWP